MFLFLDSQTCLYTGWEVNILQDIFKKETKENMEKYLSEIKELPF